MTDMIRRHRMRLGTINPHHHRPHRRREEISGDDHAPVRERRFKQEDIGMGARSFKGLGLVLGIVFMISPVFAEEVGRTPPRLSFVDGQVSFYRPGAPDWTEAQINIPLAPGDELYTGSPGNFELQIGTRSFVRGWADTHVGLQNHELDFLQFKVISGYAAFDLRDLHPGTTVEVNTPNAAFTINHPGYYRTNVYADSSTFITRRGGLAVATPVGGESITIAPNEEVILDGTTKPDIRAYAAPPPDIWDQWNYDRTNDLIDAVSARHVSPELYGIDDLDRHGTWRVVPTYGSVWIPGGVPVGWAPYSDGTWILDPYYGWTWVDRAPWGWAPYHYGRWVHVHSHWAWAPGPMVRRPVYSPALVAFMGGPGLHFGVSLSSRPSVGWVALGWGEPLVPWWGRPGFIHRPWWGGWGGPRVVNSVVIHHRQVVHVSQIHHYYHMKHGRGVMAVHREHFGRGPIRPMRVERFDSRHLKMHEAVPARQATRESFAPFARGQRPPQETINRSVVATRRPHVQNRSEQQLVRGPREAQRSGTPFRLVAPPQQDRGSAVLKRPSLGQGGDERPSRQRILNSPPAMDRRSIQRESQIKTPFSPPEAMPSGNRPNAKDRLPRLIQRQQDTESQVQPAPSLPGRPANTLSPRIRQQQQPRIAPDESVQNAPVIGGRGYDGMIRQRLGAPGSEGQGPQRGFQSQGRQGLSGMDRQPPNGFQRNSRPVR
jgi:hypothetical protein